MTAPLGGEGRSGTVLAEVLALVARMDEVVDRLERQVAENRGEVADRERAGGHDG